MQRCIGTTKDGLRCKRILKNMAWCKGCTPPEPIPEPPPPPPAFVWQTPEDSDLQSADATGFDILDVSVEVDNGLVSTVCGILHEQNPYRDEVIDALVKCQQVAERCGPEAVFLPLEHLSSAHRSARPGPNRRSLKPDHIDYAMEAGIDIFSAENECQVFIRNLPYKMRRYAEDHNAYPLNDILETHSKELLDRVRPAVIKSWILAAIDPNSDAWNDDRRNELQALFDELPQLSTLGSEKEQRMIVMGAHYVAYAEAILNEMHVPRNRWQGARLLRDGSLLRLASVLTVSEIEALSPEIAEAVQTRELG